MKLIDLVAKEIVCGSKKFNWTYSVPDPLELRFNIDKKKYIWSHIMQSNTPCGYKGDGWYIYSRAVVPGVYYAICPECTFTCKFTTDKKLEEHPYLKEQVIK